MALRHVASTLTLEQATTIATRAIAAGLGCDPPEPAPGGSPAGSTSQEETHARRGHAK
jgi:hypothetical protein